MNEATVASRSIDRPVLADGVGWRMEYAGSEGDDMGDDWKRAENENGGASDSSVEAEPEGTIA